MILLGFVFLKDQRWKNLAVYTWITVALAVPTFWMKGFAFYFFLLAILTWCEVMAFRLLHTVPKDASPKMTGSGGFPAGEDAQFFCCSPFKTFTS